jgi:AcrR family transcriptional regulator
VSRPQLKSEGKRGYQSDLRAAQTRLTRRAVVDAAAELFVRQGYAATTVDAIAGSAGVSRKTVFNAVGGKAALLKLAYDWSIVGDDEPVPMSERSQVKLVQAITDPAAAVRLWVGMVVEIGQRVTPIYRVIEAAADAEPEAAALLATAQAERLVGARHFVDRIADLGGLPPGMSRQEGAEVFWAQTDGALYRRLVEDRGWAVEKFREWLTAAVIATLLRPQDDSGPRDD